MPDSDYLPRIQKLHTQLSAQLRELEALSIQLKQTATKDRLHKTRAEKVGSAARQLKDAVGSLKSAAATGTSPSFF
jgi:hypothetical protein